MAFGQRLAKGLSKAGDAADFLSMAGNQMVVSRDLQKLKPQVGQLLRSHAGVLLVVRAEELRHVLSTQTVVQGVYLAGGGIQPEPLVHQWRTRGGYFPAMRGQLKETYLWVVRQAALQKAAHRPPGMYAVAKDADIKLVPFEQI